jgi:hypothetical protein
MVDNENMTNNKKNSIIKTQACQIEILVKHAIRLYKKKKRIFIICCSTAALNINSF